VNYVKYVNTILEQRVKAVTSHGESRQIFRQFQPDTHPNRKVDAYNTSETMSIFSSNEEMQRIPHPRYNALTKRHNIQVRDSK